MFAESFMYLAVTDRGFSVETRHPRVLPEYRYDAMRALVNACVLDSIDLSRPDLWIWCDAEGFVKGLPINLVGSGLIGVLGGPWASWMGTLLVTGRDLDAITSLTDSTLSLVLDRLGASR